MKTPIWATIFICFCWLLSVEGQNKLMPMDTLQYPFPMQKIQLRDSLDIAYVDEGSGSQALVMIHGLGSYLPAWTKLINTLKSDYRCIALDLPGYGKSGGISESYSMAFFAEVIRDFCQALELENPVLLGHSMGGQIALTTALAYPELSEDLILVAPAGIETFKDLEIAWFKNIFTPEAIEATPPERIRINFAVNFHQMQFPDDAQFMYDDRMRLRSDTIAYQAYCSMIPQCVQAMLAEPVFDRLEDIKSATLIVFGAGDLLIPNKILHPTLSTEQVATSGKLAIPGSKLEIIPDAGHFVQWEKPFQLAQRIQTFLNK